MIVADEGYEEALRRIDATDRSGGRTLSLTWLKLTTLPAEITRLTALVSLNLSYNQLTALPRAMGGMELLERAAVADGPPYTEGLHLTDNPLPAPYPPLIAQDQPQATSDVLAYLRGELDPALYPSPPDDPPEAAASSPA